MVGCFVSLDVETANWDQGSICQIGAAVFRDGRVARRWATLVNPEVEFFTNTYIHGISPGDVEDAPTFPVVDEQLRRLLGPVTVADEFAPSGVKPVIVTHTKFDVNSLERASRKYALDGFVFDWLDSAKVARRVWKGERGYGLAAVCSRLGINFTHHDAASDAWASGQIVLAAMEETGKDLEDFLALQYQAINPKRSRNYVEAQRLEGNPEGPLVGETVVFTGTLSQPRKDMAKAAQSLGANVRPGVTRKTTFLVVGIQDDHRLKGHKRSSKERKAQAWIKKGIDIRIVSEEAFFAAVS